MNTKIVGNLGENFAEEYLINLKYKIVKKNFHFGKTGEIDIIAKDNDTLVFVEVKTRTSNSYGDPILSITYSKQKALRRTAEGFLYINKINDMQCRFDVITIDASVNPHKIEHLINAF
jgi:putative endonuclease